MNKVITISRQYGSGGREVGKLLADAYGIPFYDNEIIDTEVLHVPHIDMENRDFVLKPMVEIAPYLRHPVLNLTMEQLLKKLEEKTLAV